MKCLTGVGFGVFPGNPSGMLVYSIPSAKLMLQAGKKVVLMVPMTSPEDVEVMCQVEGVVTTSGGPACHAAIVARDIRKPTIVGCEWEDGVIPPEFSVVNMDGRTGVVMYYMPKE